MKRLVFTAVMILAGLNSYASSSMERIAKLQNGAYLVASIVYENNMYKNLKVEVNGKNYSICRYEFNDKLVEKVLCTDSRKPYPYMIAKELGFFSKEGAVIDDAGRVSIQECMNGLALENLTCSDSAY